MNWVLFLALFSSSLFAQTEERRFDFDRNSRADFVEVYRQGKLVETHYDSDGDGVFDRHTYLSPESEVFKIIDIDKTKKQTRKKISFWNNELRKKTIAHFQVDKNNDGTFETSYEMAAEIDQKRETCSVTQPGKAETLAQTVLTACLAAEDYTQTDFGYRIHKSCSENGKEWVIPLIRESITKGRECLGRLADEGRRGAQRIQAALESVISNNNVQILCNETSYDWTNTLAHATTGENRNYLPLIHPGISLGPLLFEGDPARRNMRFMNTVFHEQLHNLGHRHGVEPEISYTCGDCCFPEKENAEITSTACQVCGGDYSSITDKEYLADITAYGNATYAKREGIYASLAYLRENPGDTLGLAYLASNEGGIFEPVGNELADILAARPNLGEVERSVLEEPLKNRKYPPLEPYRRGGRIVAEAYLKLYEGGSPEETLRHLRENATVLREQMDLRSGENGEFMARSIRSSIDKIIYDIWIDGYRGRAPAGNSDDPIAAEAYEVKNLLGL